MRRKYWIAFTRLECPVCGRGQEYRERMYTPKPKDPKERYEYLQSYDNCLEF